MIFHTKIIVLILYYRFSKLFDVGVPIYYHYVTKSALEVLRKGCNGAARESVIDAILTMTVIVTIYHSHCIGTVKMTVTVTTRHVSHRHSHRRHRQCLHRNKLPRPVTI